ncbi:unnamed protein product [Adineta ricciae]|uniref:G-protein coupled receptors family 1 profile domain-containing protein n=1 Tax=Adineta ricciae TaxID=249248 RepID=A0A815I6K4_ADIRI|nr:unnamed protein product [Adineta ricciae]CAF1464927.1 unnamed protein product [Adineta ricciae]
MFYSNNSPSLIAEPWFIPLDIFMIVCSIVDILLNLIFLVTILLDRTYHTIPMILIVNSCLAQVVLVQAIYFSLVDLHYFPCTFAGYMTYVTCAVLNYLFLLQAFYRYVIVVYPTRWHHMGICAVVSIGLHIHWSDCMQR